MEQSTARFVEAAAADPNVGVASFHRAARAAGIVVIVVGCAGVVGWVFDITILKSFLPSQATMKMNTAVSFVLAGASLLLQIAPSSTPRQIRRSRACALLVAAIGLLTLLEYVMGIDVGLDQLLIQTDANELSTAYPGRMPPNTASSFVFASTSLIFLDAKRAALRSMSHALAVIVLVIGFLAITGYSFGVAALHGVAGYGSMALPAAAAFTVLAIGLLAARPQRGLTAILAQDNSAGSTLRRLMPLMIGVPSVVGWVRLEGQRAGLYGTEFGLALMVTTTTSILVSLALWHARAQGMWESMRKRATDQVRLAMEAAPTAMIMTDRDGKSVLLNQQAEALFGYRRDELLGKPIEMLIPERFQAQHPQHRTAFLREPRARPMGAGRELYGRRKDGSEVPIEIGINPLATPEGEFVLSSIADITERQRATREREALMTQLEALNADLEERVQARTSQLTIALREREVLLQEVHHRVKNNLQVIASLLQMQGRQLGNGEGHHALEECQGRVHAIAMIHEKLYQTKNYAEVPFADYVRGLARDVLHATGSSPATVSLALDVDDVRLAVNKAIPCGLILNELITNAVKHAYPSGRRGEVRVQLSELEGRQLRLRVADDGVGLGPLSDIMEARSLGLKLVRTLTAQLDARLDINSDSGTSFELTFPMDSLDTEAVTT